MKLDIEKTKVIFKKYSPFIFVLAVLVIFFFNGERIFDNSDKYIKKLDSIDRVQKQKEKEHQYLIDLNEQLEQQLNQKENDYYDEYINEKKRRINAEKKLGAISSLVFNRDFLDSLADHITYPKSGGNLRKVK